MTFEEFESRVFAICQKFGPHCWIHVMITSCGFGKLTESDCHVHIGHHLVAFRGFKQEVLAELQKYADNPSEYIAPVSAEAIA